MLRPAKGTPDPDEQWERTTHILCLRSDVNDPNQTRIRAKMRQTALGALSVPFIILEMGVMKWRLGLEFICRLKNKYGRVCPIKSKQRLDRDGPHKSAGCDCARPFLSFRTTF
jgi:hypothetical protein